MRSSTSRPSAPVWTGRILSGLAVAFLLLDGVVKLAPIKPVLDTLQALGFDATDTLARGLGVLQLSCLLLYVIPRTSVLGALLFTGYLGGAMALQIRADNPLFSHILFGSYVGIFLWAGLLLRDARARSLLFH